MSTKDGPVITAREAGKEAGTSVIPIAGGVSLSNKLVLSIAEAASLLSVGISTFYAMDRSGELGPQGIRLRRRRVWRRDELVDWVRAGCPHRQKWAAMSRDFAEAS